MILKSIAFTLFLIPFMIGCGTTKEISYSPSPKVLKNTICKKKVQKSIGVTDVVLSHKTSKLVFNQSGIQSKLSVLMKNTDCFQVIDWARLKDVINRHKLEWTEIGNSPSARRKLQEIILVDYFLVAVITDYADDISYDSSAFSKSKVQTVTLSVDLIIKDAVTNEIIASVSSKGVASREVKHSLGFGGSGNPSGETPNKALDIAIESALEKLIDKLGATKWLK